MNDASVVVERCRKDPEFFMREVLGSDPWPFQVEIAEAVRDHPHVCVQACHASGKDWTTARIVLWFGGCFAPSMAVTTAPTDRQVRLILWQEIAQAYKSSRVPLGGRLLQQEWHIAPKEGAFGFSTPDYNPDAFAGLHQDHMFVVYDEANGIPGPVRKGGSGLLAGGRLRRLLEIGNPLDPSSEFAKECESPTTKTIRISAFDTPNFTEFGITRKDIETGEWRDKVGNEEMPASYLITPEWVEEIFNKRRRDWNDREVKSRILGEFPDEGEDALFFMSSLVECTTRMIPPRKHELRALGCDVARFGDDRTVIYLRVGMRFRKVDEWHGKKVTETVNRLIALARKYKVSQIRVDDDGVGGGVTDGLTEKLGPAGLEDVAVMRMNFGSGANNSDRYANRRAEWYCGLADDVLAGDVVLEHNDEMFAELRATRIKRYDKMGRIILRSKEEIKKEIGRSPDDSDGLICAYGDPSSHAPLELW